MLLPNFSVIYFFIFLIYSNNIPKLYLFPIYLKLYKKLKIKIDENVKMILFGFCNPMNRPFKIYVLNANYLTKTRNKNIIIYIRYASDWFLINT